MALIIMCKGHGCSLAFIFNVFVVKRQDPEYYSDAETRGLVNISLYCIVCFWLSFDTLES